MVICLELSADLQESQWIPLPLTVSCFNKIQIGFSFLLPAHLGSPGQRAIKRVHVCVWCGMHSCTQMTVEVAFSSSVDVVMDFQGSPRKLPSTVWFIHTYQLTLPFVPSPALPFLSHFFSSPNFHSLLYLWHFPHFLSTFLFHSAFFQSTFFSSPPALCDIERFACWKALRSHIFFFLVQKSLSGF